MAESVFSEFKNEFKICAETRFSMGRLRMWGGNAEESKGMMHGENIFGNSDVFMLELRKNMLLPGSLSERQFLLLTKLSSIRSDRVILAMKNYLVDGHSRKHVCERYNINNSYFSTTLNRIFQINALAARLAPYYPRTSFID
ncbi:adhesin biosynthesis transcription regulatory family protein [Escherichia coli]|uniref:adhesin biosynthesis transcription regulatory family protein n=1 Tax=Escherichia coli TaxID=562 RepID=UPI002552FFFC|nr:adhesin biosynthesis transcription regulatory family protein [Escherichia coli]